MYLGSPINIQPDEARSFGQRQRTGERGQRARLVALSIVEHSLQVQYLDQETGIGDLLHKLRTMPDDVHQPPHGLLDAMRDMSLSTFYLVHALHDRVAGEGRRGARPHATRSTAGHNANPTPQLTINITPDSASSQTMIRSKVAGSTCRLSQRPSQTNNGTSGNTQAICCTRGQVSSPA